ncbi:MAG: hypothetical protein PHV17_09030, partial [Candidatus Omnitrophica bacterium]|nr:hypothetical protein [Candidatus Omnitrophota bacterium]
SFLSIPLLTPDSSVTEHYGMYFSTIKRNLSITKIKKQNYFQTGGFIGGLTFFKKDIFIELNGFDEKYPFCIDDYDLSARAYLRGHKIYTLTNCVAYHIKEKNLSRESTLKKLAWKRKYELCGFTRMLLKNYRLKNIIIWFPLAAGWIFIKALKLSMRYRTFKPLLSYAKSVVYFLFDFKDTIYQRRIIQSKRTVKEDLFLKINPPR